MHKEHVVLFGASGTMGYEAFKELWKRRERFDITLFLRRSAKNEKLFKSYLNEAGLSLNGVKPTRENEALKVVWGDAAKFEDVEEAVKGADWVLNAMACIPPEADYHPKRAMDANVNAVVNILESIQKQPAGGRHICYVHAGSVAQTGDRLPPVHVGRIGDPIHPSIYDFYGATKVKGEYAVMESPLECWVSLRLTFIMPSSFMKLMELFDPILFHVPLQSCIESISDRDAGYGLVQVLDVPRDSDFWKKAYNMSGGPAMRRNAFTYYDEMFKMIGLSGLLATTERNWFTLRNFHLHFYEDSGLLNKYLGHWRDTMDDYRDVVLKSVPALIKPIIKLAKNNRFLQKIADSAAHFVFSKLIVKHRNGTRHWYLSGNSGRIKAFFKNSETYQAIPDWKDFSGGIENELSWVRLEHGYDESKERLDFGDLQQAARFRGGECSSSSWGGDLYDPVEWRCHVGHCFTARPYTILKAGHWCPECVPPAWNYDEAARHNPFLAQVWLRNHDADEMSFYDASCLDDILVGDKRSRS